MAGASTAIELLGGDAAEVHDVESVGPDSLNRTAVLVRKSRGTPDKFPRRPGMPNKRPL